MRIVGIVVALTIGFAAVGCSGDSGELAANDSMADMLKDASKSPDANKAPEGRNMQKPAPPVDGEAKK